ncbi:hypothetical protein [Tenacibaculum maritimum]|nr:hypothetical protein [Tenacibaculum maritimum]MCD9611552.1 hypothetical protein [Tenacibaculum maritimum]
MKYIRRLESKHLDNVIYESKNSNSNFVIEIAKKSFYLKLNSEIEDEPKKVYEDEKVIFVELNNTVFIFSVSEGSLLFMSKMYDDFDSVNKVYNGYLIICETSVLLISKYSFSIIMVKIFPDFIEDYEVINKKLCVFLNDEKFELLL